MDVNWLKSKICTLILVLNELIVSFIVCVQLPAYS